MNVPWGSGRFERVLVYGLGLSGQVLDVLLLRPRLSAPGDERLRQAAAAAILAEAKEPVGKVA